MKTRRIYVRLADLGFPSINWSSKRAIRTALSLRGMEWKINFTAITEKDEVWSSSIFKDSIAPILQAWSKPTHLSPDIELALVFPAYPWRSFPETINSLNKLINSLHLLAEELGLNGAHFYHGRAEDFAQDKASCPLDIVTARVVARHAVLSEPTIPYLESRGRLLLKASNAQKSWRSQMPSTCYLARLKTPTVWICQMGILATHL